MGQKVARTRNANTWTEAQFWGRIRSQLRKLSMYWIPRKEALEAVRRPNQSNNKKLKWEYQCSDCKNWFRQDGVEVHHDIEAGSLKCAEDLPGFVTRLFVENGWKVLCVACHKTKTDEYKESKNSTRIIEIESHL
jgi:hypothetical protein